MNFAVFADIHGNYVALEKCVNYVLERGIVNFIFLGDYIGELAYPQKAMQMIYDIKEKYKGYTHEELEAMNVEVSVAGRIMFIRKMGKASFFTIQDKTGKMQIYISINDVGEEVYELFKTADIGDIVAIVSFSKV